jgi:hypothetical protein
MLLEPEESDSLLSAIMLRWMLLLAAGGAGASRMGRELKASGFLMMLHTRAAS